MRQNRPSSPHTYSKITKETLNPYVITLLGTPELAERWWNSYNHYFQESPLSVLKRDPSEVRDYLLGYCYGR